MITKPFKWIVAKTDKDKKYTKINRKREMFPITTIENLDEDKYPLFPITTIKNLEEDKYPLFKGGLPDPTKKCGI